MAAAKKTETLEQDEQEKLAGILSSSGDTKAIAEESMVSELVLFHLALGKPSTLKNVKLTRLYLGA